MKTHQKSGPVLISLSILIIVAILVAGCVDSTQDQQSRITATSDKQSENPATATTKITTAQPTLTPDPFTPFITVDPISDKNTGDLVIISGTTNLPSGTSIYLKEINESTGESTMRANNVACLDTRGVNRWRFVLDSTVWMRPGRYRYLMSTPKGDVNSSVQFNIKGTFHGPETILYYQSGSKSATIRSTGSYPYITIDPIGDRKKGDIFRITGSTNLVEGTMLQCTVWPVYFEDRSKRPAIISEDDCDGQFNIAGSPTAVVKGTGDTNRWSCPVDMTIFTEKTGMIVHVSTTDEYFTAREIYGNATFELA